MMSSIEVAWKPSREKHRQALVRMCWRRWARVVSLSRGIAHSLNKNDRLRYGRVRYTVRTNQKRTFLFGGGYASPWRSRDQPERRAHDRAGGAEARAKRPVPTDDRRGARRRRTAGGLRPRRRIQLAAWAYHAGQGTRRPHLSQAHNVGTRHLLPPLPPLSERHPVGTRHLLPRLRRPSTPGPSRPRRRDQHTR